MEDLRLFTLPCGLGDFEPFNTLADLGSCNIIPLYLFKKLNIGLLEETDYIFGLADGTKSYPVFSSWVWDNLKPLLCIPNVPSALDDIVAFLIPVAKMKSIRSVVCKLVFSAACYFLWQERNYRIFKKKKRSKDKILELIKSNVRLKLLTCSFKKTPNVQMLAHIWKLPCSLVRHSPTLV
ncbi:hypothetical protein Tco_0724651 [Tanacetum coccineum]